MTAGTPAGPAPDEKPVKVAEQNTTRPDGSLIGDLRALFEDGRTLVEAELGFQRARATYALKRSKGVALLLILSLFFAFLALMALVVGLLIALAPLLTAWGATALITLVLAGLAVSCLMLALSGFRQAKARLLGKETRG